MRRSTIHTQYSHQRKSMLMVAGTLDLSFAVHISLKIEINYKPGTITSNSVNGCVCVCVRRTDCSFFFHFAAQNFFCSSVLENIFLLPLVKIATSKSRKNSGKFSFTFIHVGIRISFRHWIEIDRPIDQTVQSFWIEILLITAGRRDWFGFLFFGYFLSIFI